MAVFDYDEHGSAYDNSYGARGGALSEARVWVSLGGAITSLALVVGLAYWGYDLAMRDVTGVPVMRAAGGPMRIAPADPGGFQAPNQGLTVNAIAAIGTTAKPADTITLAPLSVTLQPDDVPVGAPAGAEAIRLQSPSHDTEAIPANAVVAAAPEQAPVLAQDSVDAAVAAALAEDSADPIAGATRPALRPKPRPADLGGTRVQVSGGTQIVPDVVEKDPSTIPPGTVLAQFGAYETREVAVARFGDLQQKFGGALYGKAMIVQSAETNGRTIYRLRVDGLANEADANAFCIAMQAEGTECVPVAQR
jgi:SPOR domain